MAKLQDKGKRIILKVTAALAAISISPPLSALVSDKAVLIEELWEEELSTHEARGQKAVVSLAMSGTTSLLYKPSPDGGFVITQSLPFANLNTEYNDFDDYNDYESSYDYNLPGFLDYPEHYDFSDFANEPVAQVLSQNITEIREEPLGFTVEDGRIVKLNYPPNGGAKFLNLDLAGQIRNETSLDNDFVINESRKLPEIKLELNGEPEVLIMHTHTTEAFQPCGYDYFETSYYGRSLDSEKNIVAVGAEMAKSFAEAGITVIHDGTVHDYPVFNNAYARSAQTVRQILAAYPSIKIVLDVHRDAIDAGDGSRVAPVTQFGGQDAAQVMIISAADDGTYDIPYYLQNFHLASLFQQHMEYDYPGITRPVLFQYCQYNQHLTPGSLLVEVGAYGNTLEEAMYAGRLIGKSMADALLSLT
ncbi:MAG: stage II sporulation protein P [Oscillospiraceae bacterium]|nr:stage II sporulation protein P [Oscillospiraceae bacterium]